MPAPTFVCPQCHTTLRLPESAQPGMLVRCPSCGSNVRVPGEEVTAAPPAAPPPPREGFTDLPAGREDGGYDDDRPDGPPEGPGLEGLSRDYTIQVGDWFRYGAAHWSAVLGAMIGYLFVIIGIGLAAGCFLGIIVGILQGLLGVAGQPGPAQAISTLLNQVIQLVLNVFVLVPLQAGFTVVALAQLQGRRWSFGDFFGGFQRYGAVVVITLILMLIQWACTGPGGVLVGVGFANQVMHLPQNPAAGGGAPAPDFSKFRPDDPLLIGGSALVLVGLVVLIYFNVRFIFALPLIFDRGCRGIEALQGSWMLTRGHFWGLFGVLLLLGLINLGGFLLLCVGVLFTFPLTHLVLIAGYLLIAGTRRPVATPRLEPED